MEDTMTIGLHNCALALGIIGSAAFLPAPSYAVKGDVEVYTPGASVEIERDRPGILARRGGPDVTVETPGPDVYVEGDHDDYVPPGASVEIDPDD
jgi:hypothetical protein